jgi:signal transduction histidine kinase
MQREMLQSGKFRIFKDEGSGQVDASSEIIERIAASTGNQDRHLMMPALLDTRNFTHRPCWLSADRADACVITPDCSAIRTQRRKFSSAKLLPTRSHPRSCSSYEAIPTAPPLPFKTHGKIAIAPPAPPPLSERRRRHVAEATARQTMSELSPVSRVATASELSASIAHEVNQPLAGMVLNASACIRWLTAPSPDLGKVEVGLKQIVDAGLHASEVIKSFRGLFKRSTEERQPVQINELISNAISLERRDIDRHQVSLTLEQNEWLPEILGDRVQLLQVILNLIRNAIEAMSPDRARTLHIKSERDESGDVLVSVQDSGTGIDQQNLARIFDPLFTTKPQELGIGLSICRSIIESHYGRLWVTSKIGQGSTFFINLPRHKAGDGWQLVTKRS